MQKEIEELMKKYNLKRLNVTTNKSVYSNEIKDFFINWDKHK